MSSVPKLTFVLGGARSGKSRYGESVIATLPPPWTYVATAQALDAEMAERIAAHRARRGAQWRTIEAPRDLAAVLAACQTTLVLVDCLTLWLSNQMLADADIDLEMTRLEDALLAAKTPIVLIANEVGSGSCRIIRSAENSGICRACSISAWLRAPIAWFWSSPDCRSP